MGVLRTKPRVGMNGWVGGWVGVGQAAKTVRGARMHTVSGCGAWGMAPQRAGVPKAQPTRNPVTAPSSHPRFQPTAPSNAAPPSRLTPHLPASHSTSSCSKQPP